MIPTLRVGYHDLPRRFPLRGPECQGSLTLIDRNSQEYFTRDRNDERNNHNGKDQARRKEADAVKVSLEYREKAEHTGEYGYQIGTDHREQRKNPNQSIDDARNGRQQFDQKRKNAGEPRRREFRKEYRGHDAERHGRSARLKTK